MNNIFSIECKIYFVPSRIKKKEKYLNIYPLNPLFAYFYNLNIRVIRSGLECIFNLFIFKLSILQDLTILKGWNHIQIHYYYYQHRSLSTFRDGRSHSHRFDSKGRIASSIVERLQRIRSPFHEKAAFVNGWWNDYAMGYT